MLTCLSLNDLHSGVALAAGHKTRPSDGVLRSYHQCIPRNDINSRHVKTIVNTKHADIAAGCASLRNGIYTCKKLRNTPHNPAEEQ